MFGQLLSGSAGTLPLSADELARLGDFAAKHDLHGRHIETACIMAKDAALSTHDVKRFHKKTYEEQSRLIRLLGLPPYAMVHDALRSQIENVTGAIRDSART